MNVFVGSELYNGLSHAFRKSAVELTILRLPALEYQAAADSLAGVYVSKAQLRELCKMAV